MSASARARRLLAVLAVGACGVLVWAPPAAATPWGASGADFSGGIVCRLSDASTVPMAHWSVNGGSVFSTADVLARGPLYGPAPTSGSTAPIIPGQAGLDGAEIATIAYLVEHHGSGSAVEVAETSADIAALTGQGGAQAQCLGQQGTSRAHAAALLTQARRYAGPYTVTVGAPGPPTTAGRLPVSATVRSAAGAGVAGVQVQFTTDDGTATALADSTGVARTVIAAQRTTSTLLATVDERTSLSYVASSPPALAPAEPTRFTGAGHLAAVVPRPVVSVTGSADLVLSQGKATPSAQVTGTFGYSGSGTMTVSGPVQPADGQGCSALPASAFARAPTVSTAPFDFSGDARFQAGATPALAAGCYVAHATLTTSGSNPPVSAASAVDAAAVFTVATVSLSQADTATVAPAGPLHATVTATTPGRATVTSSLVARGPLATAAGDCAGSGVDWSNAPTAATSEPVQLTEQPHGSAGRSTSAAPVGPGATSNLGSDTPSLGATISTPRVSEVGCYALVSRNTVSLDGKSVIVEGTPGAVGATTLIAEPKVTIANATYDSDIGKPMTGSVTVSGSYRFAGAVSVGLIATKVPEGGCHPVTFTDRSAVMRPTVTATTGDGVYTFRSPKPTRNLCYAVTAVLRLDANHAVRSNSPDPSTNTIFLAGASLIPRPLTQLRDLSDHGLLRPVLTVSVTYGLLFLVALLIVIKAAGARRPELLGRAPSG